MSGCHGLMDMWYLGRGGLSHGAAVHVLRLGQAGGDLPQARCPGTVYSKSKSPPPLFFCVFGGGGNIIPGRGYFHLFSSDFKHRPFHGL